MVEILVLAPKVVQEVELIDMAWIDVWSTFDPLVLIPAGGVICAKSCKTLDVPLIQSQIKC